MQNTGSDPMGIIDWKQPFHCTSMGKLKSITQTGTCHFRSTCRYWPPCATKDWHVPQKNIRSGMKLVRIMRKWCKFDRYQKCFLKYILQGEHFAVWMLQTDVLLQTGMCHNFWIEYGYISYVLILSTFPLNFFLFDIELLITFSYTK